MTSAKAEQSSHNKTWPSAAKPKLEETIRAASAVIDEGVQRFPQYYFRLLRLILKQEGNSAAAGRQIVRYDINTGRKFQARNWSRGSSNAESTQSPNFVEAPLSTAAKLGSDGRGKDGVVGFLQKLAQRYPARYALLLLLIQKMQCRLSLLALKNEHRRIERERKKRIFAVNRAPKLEAENGFALDTCFDPTRGLSLTAAILLAAAKVGFNGRGKQGIVGYYRTLGVNHRGICMRFFSAILDVGLRHERATARFNQSGVDGEPGACRAATALIMPLMNAIRCL